MAKWELSSCVLDLEPLALFCHGAADVEPGELSHPQANSRSKNGDSWMSAAYTTTHSLRSRGATPAPGTWQKWAAAMATFPTAAGRRWVTYLRSRTEVSETQSIYLTYSVNGTEVGMLHVWMADISHGSVLPSSKEMHFPSSAVLYDFCACNINIFEKVKGTGAWVSFLTI